MLYNGRIERTDRAKKLLGVLAKYLFQIDCCF